MGDVKVREWDLEAVYDEQINPLMAQIIAICKAHELPMIASFAYASNEDSQDYCTTQLQWDGREPDALKRAGREILRGRDSFVALTITTKPEGRTPPPAARKGGG